MSIFLVGLVLSLAMNQNPTEAPYFPSSADLPKRRLL
jgi:hypothetical protein